MPLGPLEILLLLAVIALLFGAKKLPDLMKGMGQGVREFRAEVGEGAAPLPPVVTDAAPRPQAVEVIAQHERR